MENEQAAGTSQGGAACPLCRQAFDPVLRQPVTLPVSKLRICRQCHSKDLEPSRPEGSENGEFSVETSSNETHVDKKHVHTNIQESAPAPGMNSRTKKILIGVGVTVGAVGAIAAAPVVLAATGFTSGGIAAGSFAASMMSSAAAANGGAIAAGSTVAVLQSAGAAGIGAATSAGLAAGGGAIGGATAVGINKVMGSEKKQ
ncbi:interferon alpha-inducible protein 27-like protein 2B [Penaeus chinensis]|uniref:interferon alpha-inducible protein 27-like protein 2B n=1 Tax=Penaeus chinensis TaxID=139456 RepID=UPI001FB7ACC0|nr:interferon alpha-inducible protein 27-like protein 2B [Penaeus chinensis]